MKKLFLYFSLILLVSSCQKDEESNTDNSDGDARSVFIGTWVCEEQSEIFGTTTYPVYINAHSSISNRVVVDHFYNLIAEGNLAQFEINGNGINIFTQTINGFEITGSGTLLNASEISLAYVADDGSGPDNVTAIYTKTSQ